MIELGTSELFILFIIPLSLLGTAFWIWMLVDCLRNEPNEGNEKLIWVLVIALAGCVGAGIYFFVRRPARPQKLG